MPQPEPLHPNLARLAAAYDEIFERWSRRELQPSEARGQIMALVTRDDQGVQWRLHPDTGVWQRQTIHGDWVEGAPPTYGLATPTAHDLSAGTAANPDGRLALHAVDESLLYGPQSLAGATRRPQLEHQARGLRERLTRTHVLIAALVLVVLVGAAALTLSHHAAPPPVTGGSQTTTTAPSGPLGAR